MRSFLRYGENLEVGLDVPDGALVAEFLAPRGEPIGDPQGAVAAALASPLDFPPLEQAVVPGDRVVLALGADVPCARAVVGALLETLLRRGVEPGAITILRPETAAAQSKDLALIERSVKVVTHQPGNREQLAYLAATADGKPVYLNRALCDADMVVPITCLHSGSDSGSYAAGIYPTFSDQVAIERYRHPGLANPESEVAERARHEANEVAWLLGILFTVQTVPGSRGEVLHVVAGSYETVARRATELYDRAWNCAIPCRASLVVAGLEGGAGEQTWENLGRAITAAGKAVSDDGAIAILSDLEQDPGPGVRRLGDFENPRDAVRHLRKERPRDVVPAIQLAQALSRARVYLLSRLQESLIEDLGVAPVENTAEIARLVRRHSSCIVLSSAQRAVPIAREKGA
jgi:nickel-dependent lactate racemase